MPGDRWDDTRWDAAAPPRPRDPSRWAAPAPRGGDGPGGRTANGRVPPSGRRATAPWASDVAGQARPTRRDPRLRPGPRDGPAPGARAGRDPRRVHVGGPSPGASPTRRGEAPAGRRPGRGPGERRGRPPDSPRHARPRGAGARGRGDGRRGRRSWLQRLVLAAGTAIVLVCLLGASLGTYLVVKYGSIERADVELPQAPPGEPENFLIVAVDTREGHNGVNTDTIMVLRVDPKSDRLALTSFPRDLIVTVADTGEKGMINAVYNRPDDKGPQNLIDTLQQNFGVTINHFVEVNFDSFQRVVDSVGGVPVFMERAARDKGSGFYNEQLGCVNLNGEDALEFVRSRKLEVLIDGEWRHDPLSDVNRVKRQQIFIQRAMSKVLARVKDNPLYLHELIDIGVDTVKLDPNLTIGDLRDLGERFKDFDPAELETYPLPVVDHPTQRGRLLLDEAEAEPILNVFRGLDPSEISPSRVTVQVLNGTVADPAQQRENLASDVSAALQQVGFTLRQPGDADTFYAHTTIQHAPGQELFAQRVARHITSETAIPTEVNPELGSGEVVVIAGADFTTVHEVPTPIDQMPPPAGAPAPETPETPETTAPPETTTTTTSPPPTTTTTENPFIIGQPPEGARC